MSQSVNSNSAARAFIERFEHSPATLLPDTAPHLLELLSQAGQRMSRALQSSIRFPDSGIFAASFCDLGLGARVPITALPANLYRLAAKENNVHEIYDFIDTQPIPLHSVPSPHIAKELLKATSEEERKAVVARYESELLEKCDEIFSDLDPQQFHDEMQHYSQARAVFDVELYRAAQATTAALIDAGTFRRAGQLEKKQKDILSHKDSRKDIERRAAILDDMVVSEYVVWATVWNAYSTFWGWEQKPPPTIFNRHACAHSVKACQYSRVNAVIGFMIAASVVKLLSKHSG